MDLSTLVLTPVDTTLFCPLPLLIIPDISPLFSPHDEILDLLVPAQAIVPPPCTSMSTVTVSTTPLFPPSTSVSSLIVSIPLSSITTLVTENIMKETMLDPGVFSVTTVPSLNIPTCTPISKLTLMHNKTFKFLNSMILDTWASVSSLVTTRGYRSASSWSTICTVTASGMPQLTMSTHVQPTLAWMSMDQCLANAAR